MLKKGIGLALAGILIAIFVMQVKFAGATSNEPLTGPLTSPITVSLTVSPTVTLTPTPTCKPGNGFGDKNHCHFGPPGHDNDNDDHDKHGDKDNHDDHNGHN